MQGVDIVFKESQCQKFILDNFLLLQVMENGYNFLCRYTSFPFPMKTLTANYEKKINSSEVFP